MSPEEFARLNAIAHQNFELSQRQSSSRGKTPQKHKNFLLDQISTAGGILGGIGGSFVAPVLGTGAGAAAGSALGEAIENVITGDKLTKNVGKEALLGGVFGVGPGRILKSGIQGGAKVLGKDIVKNASTRTAGQRGAQNLLGSAWGIKTGAKAGSDTLTPQSARNLQQFIKKDVGVPRSANADMVAERLVNYRKLAGQNIDDIVKNGDRTLSPQELSSLATSVNGKIAQLAGIDAGNPVANRLSQQLAEKKSLSDLIKFRRNLDEAINFSRNPNSPDPITERLAKTMRSEIDKLTSKLVPGLKNANRQYAQATKALDYVLPAAKNPKGLNVFNNKIGGGLSQRIQSFAGQGGGGVGSRLSKPTTAPSAKGIITRFGVGEAGKNIIDSANQQPATLEDAVIDTQSSFGNNQMAPSTINPNTIQNMGLAYQNDASLSSPYTKENLLADLQRDPQNAEDYIGYYQSLQDIFGKQGSEPLNSTAAGVIADTETGLQALSDLSNSIGSNSANNPLIGRIRGANPFDTTAQNLQAQIATAKQIVGKALEGGVLRKEDEAKYAKILPTLNDTDAVAQEKIRLLQNLISQRLDEYKTGIGQGGGGMTLEDALMQQSGY